MWRISHSFIHFPYLGMSFFWFSLVFMQEQLCSRVHSYGINLDVNCVGYTSGNEIIDFFSIWKCLICFYYLFQFSLASMLQEQASGKNTPLNPKHLRFEAGNSNILNQRDKTKILSYVSCFYSKCLAKIVFLLSASWLWRFEYGTFKIVDF